MFGTEASLSFSILTCPKCKSGMMHQIHVEVGFRRQQDEDKSLVVKVNQQGLSTEYRQLPGRRHDMRIFFACEDCHGFRGWEDLNGKHVLRIWQHKGSTRLAWTLGNLADPEDTVQ